MKSVVVKKISNLVVMMLLLLSFTGCEKDLYDEAIQTQSVEKEVTFEQFKKETGLKNFSTTLQINQGNPSGTLRNADGSYELSDFVIDTELIKRFAVDEKVSYTFEIHPKVITNTSVFNLTVFRKDGEWKSSVLQLTPTAQNRMDLENGVTHKFDGQVKKIYDDSKSESNPVGARVIVIFHCTGCDGPCDYCPQCMHVVVTPPHPTWIGGEFVSGGGISFIEIDNGGGGSVITNPYYQDPSGYVFAPVLTSLEDGITSIRTQRALDFWTTLTTNSGGEQDWALHHQDAYNAILDYVLDNYNTNSVNFAHGLINGVVNNTFNTDFALQLIDISLLNKVQFDITSGNNINNSLVFNDISQLEDYVSENNASPGVESSEEVVNQEGRFAYFRFKIKTLGGVLVKGKIIQTPTSYSIQNVTSAPYGVTFFSTWTQNDFHVSYPPNHKVKIVVTGSLVSTGLIPSIGLNLNENYVLTVIMDIPSGIIDYSYWEKIL